MLSFTISLIFKAFARITNGQMARNLHLKYIIQCTDITANGECETTETSKTRTLRNIRRIGVFSVLFRAVPCRVTPLTLLCNPEVNVFSVARRQL
jgi:hypothetical protein